MHAVGSEIWRCSGILCGITLGSDLYRHILAKIDLLSDCDKVYYTSQ